MVMKFDLYDTLMIGNGNVFHSYCSSKIIFILSTILSYSYKASHLKKLFTLFMHFTSIIYKQ